jgi:cell division protein FtsQ
MRQQQKLRQQARQRRWLAALGVTAGLGVLLGGIAFAHHYLSQPGRLPLRVIQVEGELSRLGPEEIQRTVVAAIDGGFFTCDMQRLRTAVLAMPWVEDVSIRRAWPDRLQMVVTEQVPLARWGDDALINVNGGVFRPASLDDFPGLVKLSGPEGSQQRVVAFFQAAVPAARARGLRVTEVQVDERRHWWLLFDGGLTVSLGREDVGTRLAQFFRVYPSLVAEAARRPQRVDMRYAHGFAVRWQEPAPEETVAQPMKSQGKV